MGTKYGADYCWHPPQSKGALHMEYHFLVVENLLLQFSYKVGSQVNLN